MLWVKVLNDGSGTAKKGNYDWSVGINEVVMAAGKVKGHQKAKGWKKLLKKVTNAAMKVPTFKMEGMEPDLPFTPEHATA